METLHETLTKRSQIIKKFIVTDSMGKIVSLVSMQIIVNQISMLFLEVDFCIGYVVNNQKERRLFPDHDEINRKDFASIHGRHDRNWCTMENIRYRNFPVNKTRFMFFRKTFLLFHTASGTERQFLNKTKFLSETYLPHFPFLCKR